MIKEENEKNDEMKLKNSTAAVFYTRDIASCSFAAYEICKEMKNAGNIICEMPVNDIFRVLFPLNIIVTVFDSIEAQSFFRRLGAGGFPAPSPQGYFIKKELLKDRSYYWIIGFDTIGAMYGGLDAAESIRLYGGLDRLNGIQKTPYIKNRGIKFNIPLDARTPSYSDAGDSAQKNIVNMWQIDFWHEFLDEMARNRYNVLSFWNEHPFPSMVKVPEYVEVALADVKKTTIQLTSDLAGQSMSTSASLSNLVTIKSITIEEKIAFWQKVMQYAEDRGIDIYIFVWNVFVFGTEDSGYGFTTSLSDIRTIDYFRKSVKQLIRTYPLLKGIGISAGENMNGEKGEKEDWLWKTYGLGINDALEEEPGRNFRLIHRTIVTEPGDVGHRFDALSKRCILDFSYKYSIAHMYSSHRPPFIHNDRFFESLPEGAMAWLTVRDDDFYMFRWGDSRFARNYIKSIPSAASGIQGFYMGPDGYTWGREYISRDPDTPNQLVIKKRWYSFMLFGRLSFDPEISDDLFKQMIGKRFPEVSSDLLFDAWMKVSQIIPMVTSFHWSNSTMDFCWYPEACIKNHIGEIHINGCKIELHTIMDFINDLPMDGSNMISIKDYTAKLTDGEELSGITPIQLASELKSLADQGLELISGMEDIKSKELGQTVGDIKAMAWLGRYYSLKILGAVNKCLYDQSKELKYKEAAIMYLKDASEKWRNYASIVKAFYIPQILTRFVTINSAEAVDIEKLQSEVDGDIELV